MFLSTFDLTGGEILYETSYWVVLVARKKADPAFLLGTLLTTHDPALATKHAHSIEAVGARKAWLSMPVAAGVDPADVRIRRVRSESTVEFG